MVGVVMSMMYNPQIQRMLADEKAKAKKPKATSIFGNLPPGAAVDAAAQGEAMLTRPPILANKSTPYVVGTPDAKGLQSNMAAAVAAHTPAKPAPEAQPPLVAGAPVYGPASLAQTRPDRVPGMPVAGPSPLTPAAPGTTGPAAQRAADLDAQIATYRRTLVGGPTITPQERMLAQEKLRALLPERKALEGAQAPGPKFLDAAGASNSTQRLLEQTIAQLKTMQGQSQNPDPSLATRLASTQAELDKVKSGQYAQEYDSPERVAAREAAMQRHLAYTKAQQGEADRLGGLRQRAMDEEAQQRAIRDAAVQAQLDQLKHTGVSLDQGDRLTEAQIREAESSVGMKAKLTDAQLQRLAQENRAGEQQFKDSQKFGPERDALAKAKISAETERTLTEQQKDKMTRDMLEPMLGGQASQQRAQIGYRNAGFENRQSALNYARDQWTNLVKPSLGGMTDADHVVTGEGWRGEVAPEKAAQFVASVVDPVEVLAKTAPEEARVVARNILALMPPNDFVGHDLITAGRSTFAETLNAARARLRAIAGQ